MSLTVRDPQECYASMRETFLTASGPDGQPPIPSAGGGVLGEGDDWFQMMADLRDKQTPIVHFKRHLEDVSGYVLGHRLLVYEVRQGWKPLCDLLEVLVPDEPFPRLNDSEALKDLMAHYGPNRSTDPPEVTLIKHRGCALDAEGCQVEGTVFFQLEEAATGRVNLAYAQIGTLTDNLAGWSDTCDLVGFFYLSLGGLEYLNRTLKWISSCKPFSPHVYTQLADTYPRLGHEGFAKKWLSRGRKCEDGNLI